MPDYFTPAEFRELPDVAAADFSDAQVEEAAAYITAIIDREIFGTVAGQTIGFVPRQVVETLDGRGTSAVVLGTPYVRSLTTVTVDGSAVDVADLTHAGGTVRYTYDAGGWTSGIANVVVTYMAGYSDEPPADIKGAAMHGTRWRLLTTAAKSSQAARQVSTTNEAGGTTTYVIAGKERPTGFPEVDAVILGWKAQTPSFGFA